MIVDALQLFAAQLCLLLAGLGVLRLVAGPRLAVDGWSVIGLAYLAGVALVGVLASLLLVAGLGLSVPEVLALCLGVFALGMVRRVRPKLAGSYRRLEGDRTVVLPALALSIMFLALLAVDLSFQPLFRSDSWGQWTLKGRAIVLLDGLDLRLWSNEVYRGINPDYPLLIPAIEAIDFRFMGFNTQILHLQFWLLTAAFVCALYALLRNSVPRTVLWPVLAAIVVAPRIAWETASAYADVPLGIFFALAGVCGWRWLRTGEPASFFLLLVFSAAALATKIEGIVFVAALFVMLFVLAGRASRSRPALMLGLVGIALATILPWRLWVERNGVPGHTTESHAFSPGFLLDHLDRVPTALGALVRETFDPMSWLLLVPLVVVASASILLYRGDWESSVYVLGTVSLSLVGLLWIYWATPLELDFHLATSSNRVVVGPVLFAAALLPVLLSEAFAGIRRRELTEPAQEPTEPQQARRAATYNVRLRTEGKGT